MALSQQTKEKDPFFHAPIRRTIAGLSFDGMVVDIEIGAISGVRLYRIQYSDGDMEHVTEDLVRQCVRLRQPRIKRHGYSFGRERPVHRISKQEALGQLE